MPSWPAGEIAASMSNPSASSAQAAPMQSEQLAITLANLKAVDASICHSLGLAADTAEALGGLTADTETLSSLMDEFAQCTQTIGTLLHDEIDKLGGPISIAVARVANFSSTPQEHTSAGPAAADSAPTDEQAQSDAASAPTSAQATVSSAQGAAGPSVAGEDSDVVLAGAS